MSTTAPHRATQSALRRSKKRLLMKILILNGPNLNLLGQREPGIYGNGTMDSCLNQLSQRYPQVEFLYFQSNVEGFFIDRLQQAITEDVDGVVLNAGAYTHTSIALHDAIPQREVPRHRSTHLQRTPARRVSPPLLHRRRLQRRNLRLRPSTPTGWP